MACKPNGPDDDWVPAIKLSDTAGKNSGDKEMIELAKKTLGVD